MCKNTLLVVVAQATISLVPLTQAACSALVHDFAQRLSTGSQFIITRHSNYLFLARTTVVSGGIVIFPSATTVPGFAV